MADTKEGAQPEKRDDGALLTYQQLHVLTGLALGTLYEKVARREIPHVRLGRRLVRFERDAVEAWLAKHRVAAERSSADQPIDPGRGR